MRLMALKLPLEGFTAFNPRSSLEVVDHGSARSMSVDFTLVASAVEPVPGRQAYRLQRDAPTQPNAIDLWGIDIPLIIPENLWSWVTHDCVL